MENEEFIKNMQVNIAWLNSSSEALMYPTGIRKAGKIRVFICTLK